MLIQKTQTPTTTSTSSESPSASARRYAQEVLAGKIPACKWVKLACQRFVNDLTRTDWEFVYDEELADRAVRFMEKMPHTKGKWAAKRERLLLAPWQRFIECNLFGWVHQETGFRRFRESYEEIPRKNGKSLRAAARGIYLFCADQESGAEVYSGATSEKQAWEVYRTAWMMVQKLDKLRSRYGVEQAGNAKNPGPMYVTEDMSRFEALIGKPGDGASVHAAIIDEYHEHDSDHMASAMNTGMGSREQPLLSFITTAGTNLGGPCYEKRKDVCRILEGTVIADSVFGIIYTIDDDDDWQDPASLIKANPNYGVSVFSAFLLEQLAGARRSATKQNAFRTKHLNQWVGARTAWMNMLAWQRQRREMRIEDFAGCPCWMAGDLASKKDVAALLLLFLRDGHYHCIPRFYVPEAAVEENEKYQEFVTAGEVIQTPGSMIDQEFIETDLLEIIAKVNLQSLAFDEWQANYLITRLQKNESLKDKVFVFAQTVKNMSDPMKEVEARALARTLWHDGNTCMTWMMGNVAARVDAKDNIYPRKDNENSPLCKIDGVVGLIMAMGRALAAPIEEKKFQVLFI